MPRTSIPGFYCEHAWSAPAQKRRHFVVEGQNLKLFGRRGKTFKSQINLTAVSALRPATDSAAPTGTLELQVRTLRATLTYFLWPERSAAELFLALGNAVPSHATSDDLWHTHMRSRPSAGGNEFRVGKTLGSGTFGKVKLAQRMSDGQVVAIKCLNRSRIVLASQGERLAKEIRLLKLLNHPNVIRLHEVLHTPSEILLVMEYVPGGDLLEVLNSQPRFTEKEVRHIFGQICCGVAFCHSLGVAHRDLKPENVLILRRGAGAPEAYLIKVADFGLSTIMQAGELLTTSCGSPHYVAPEVLDFDGTARYDGRESDVWSLGVILHVLLCYRLPFEADSTALLYKKIRRGLPSLPPRLSAAANELLFAMIEVMPEKRISLDQVMKSAWLSLEVEAPSLSLLLDAVVDADTVTNLDSSASTAWALIAPSRLRTASGIPGSPSGDGPRPPPTRRAFTFDVLPHGFGDYQSVTASPPASAVPSRQASGTGSGAVFQAGPVVPAGGGQPGPSEAPVVAASVAPRGELAGLVERCSATSSPGSDSPLPTPAPPSAAGGAGPWGELGSGSNSGSSSLTAAHSPSLQTTHSPTHSPTQPPTHSPSHPPSHPPAHPPSRPPSRPASRPTSRTGSRSSSPSLRVAAEGAAAGGRAAGRPSRLSEAGRAASPAGWSHDVSEGVLEERVTKEEEGDEGQRGAEGQGQAAATGMRGAGADSEDGAREEGAAGDKMAAEAGRGEEVVVAGESEGGADAHGERGQVEEERGGEWKADPA